MQESGSEIGFTVGDNMPESVRFVLRPDVDLKRWEYVSVGSRNSTVIARVERIISRSDLLKEGIDYSSVEKFVNAEIDESVTVAVARTTGSIKNGEVFKSGREIIRPGTPVRKASGEILAKLFGFDEEDSIYVGNLADHEDIPIAISLSGLRRHLAILSQTGAGKSNAAAVLIEEILKKGGTIVVLDPHADYVLMKRSSSGKVFTENTKVFRTPMSTGRYSGEMSAITEMFTLRFQDLDEDDLFDIMRINEKWTTLRDIVREVLQKTGGKRDLKDFLESVEKLSPDKRGKISGRVALLRSIKEIFSHRTTDISEYLGPGQLSVLDLSGLDQDVTSYFTLRVLEEIYDRKVSGEFKLPVFVFIEEAHNFVGIETSGKLPLLIKKIAGEGRKFGVFLVVITQRPGKIDQDVLSQCNSQIILRITNPIDQRAIAESCEFVSQSIIDDLPSLNTGEAVLTGQIVRFPTVVRIRRRETMEGGGDIDLLALLKESRAMRDKLKDPKAEKDRITKLMEG
ncbi:MAG: helicase HerA domain-containing protein [Thermoplasmataceae archaeon]